MRGGGPADPQSQVLLPVGHTDLSQSSRMSSGELMLLEEDHLSGVPGVFWEAPHHSDD